MTKNLTPASYEKSVELAVLLKYLWLSVYEKYASPDFFKINAPRIIHVIGSKNYNPSQGTETLGEAGGGLKISLFNTNNLDVANIDVLNEYFIKTIHHEFAHILDQTHLRPTSFNLISRSQYDASTWTETPDSLAAGRGFVSPYAGCRTWIRIALRFQRCRRRLGGGARQLCHTRLYQLEPTHADGKLRVGGTRHGIFRL